MKLGNYVAEHDSILQKTAKLDGLIGFFDYISKASGSTGSAPTIGVDTLVNAWVRQQFAYREQLLEDLFTISRVNSEIAAPVLHIKNEVFRRGIAIKPKFVKKCNECGHEHEILVEKCEKCESDDLRNPDTDQLATFKPFLHDCNVFHQRLEDVLKQFHEYDNTLDDAFLYVQKEYQVTENDASNKVVKSRPVEFRTLRSSAVEFDLDDKGLPANRHWICVMHREKDPQDSAGICPEKGCGLQLRPAMYKYKHRGRMMYLLESEVCHDSKFHQSETYGYCYDDQTEIMTETGGWKLFSELDSGDRVATLNPETNELVYQKPSLIWSQDYNGPMYEMDDKRTKMVHLKVTPQHKLFTKFDEKKSYALEEAKNALHRRVFTRIGGAIWKGEEKEVFSLPRVDFYRACGWAERKHEEMNMVHCPSINIPMDLWLEFFGYYITEGNLTGKDTNGSQVCISQNFLTAKWQKIKDCLDKLPFPYRYYGHKFIVQDSRVHEYMKQFGKAHDKFIPREYKQLSQRQLRILFDALILGDGSWHNYPKHGGYTSVSKRLLSDVSEIATKLGYSTRLWSYEKYGRDTTKFLFNLRSEVSVNKAAISHKNEKYSDRYVEYAGEIWCCEVPLYHILLVRSKGRSAFSGNSPILTVFEKALTLLGMDKTLFRYFFERKIPASLLMIGTDDPDAIKRAREEMVAQLRANPDFTPIVGYSIKTGRGRVDMVRLFHTLQEMDYLPVRAEIRERVAAIWGLPPMWQSEYSGIGGLSGQTQQMVQFSRVIESDQRIFNEKVFPFILSCFGVTDWQLMLKQPEEKAEATRIQFAQQRVMIATALMQMGFTIELKQGMESIDDIDFKVSGKAQNPMDQMGEMGMGGGMPLPENMNQPPPPFQQRAPMAKGWTDQLVEKGMAPDTVADVVVLQNGMTALTFCSKGEDQIAVFQPTGVLIDIYKYQPPVHRQTLFPKHRLEDAMKPEQPEKLEKEDESEE